MRIKVEDIEKMARLARLSFTDEEKQNLASHLDTIVSYVEKLDELDTTDVQPTYHVLDMQNVLRDDVVEPSLHPDEVLRNAPNKKNGYFSVPKVIG